MTEFIAWHGKNLTEHVKLRDDAAKNGYRFLSLSVHGLVSDPHYSAVMIKRRHVVAQRDWPALTANEFQATFDAEAKLGFGPVIIAATGTGSNPLFAAVFEPANPIPLTRHRLTSGDADNLNTIQGMDKKAHADGLIPRWLAVYGDSSSPMFAGIWVPNSEMVVWNADGLVDSGSYYQMRFNAQTSGWCRPALVAVSPDIHYMSLFVDNEVGPWVARHGMTADQYQAEFDTWVPKGFFPSFVQGGGSGSSTRYAALFVKSERPVRKHFQATGPIANAAIDAVIEQAMRDSPVRHASLSIVHGSKLVYTRAYTWGEPDWPLVQPTSRFRQASVSKTVMALAIYQLIEVKLLKLSDKMQDILKLKTPSGGAPKSSQFMDITIRHLLEHTSGINAGAFDDDIGILNAFKTAQPNVDWKLPVSADMTDSFIASLDMVSDPGTAQVYNNCGYYLLGRILAKVRGKSTPIEALDDFLFHQLHIHRIRRATSLIATTPANEARYRAHDIPVAQSVMTNDRPLVPVGYGNEQYTDKEGSGGLSAATPDLARLIAILLSPNNNPALQRATIQQMLDNAVANQNAWNGKTTDLRAGYGFDRVANLGNGRYYGQKGGSLSPWGNVISGTVFQIDGDWGFAMSWGGTASAATGWYPNYPAVMNIAKQVAWEPADLFPSFGMPSL